MRTAVARWREALESWAIPAAIRDAAPVDPWGHDPATFADRAARVRDLVRPADEVARDALSAGGSVLDVGCGGGAASLPLAATVGTVTGVDASEGMLRAFAAAWRPHDVAAATVLGRWPTVTGEVQPADVVVCHDVLYDVPDVGPFVAGLHAHARRRVVLVLPDLHPMTWLTPYWVRLHDLDRPTTPTIDDAVAVIREVVGHEPERRAATEPTRWATADRATAIAVVRRRLCLPAGRDAEVAAVLAEVPPPVTRTAVTLWWDVPGW